MVAVVVVAARGQRQHWRWRRWTVDESMQKPPSPYDKPSSNLTTRNHSPRCKQTMPRHTHYSPTKSYPKHSRPWTCGSTGYGAATPKDNSAITGDLAHRTWQITSPSTTPPHTTSLYTQQFSHQPTIQNTRNSSRTQETPRIQRAQIITSEKKTSKNRQKLLNRKAQKITREAKLPKIAENSPSWRGQKIPPITTSQKCRATHPVVCRLPKKTQFFKANNLLIAKFPRPTSLTSNTVDKLNKSRSTGLVNIFMLVLPLVRWWWCCCCLFLQQWTMVSSTMVVTVAVVVAWWQRQQWQRQRWRRRWWTTICGKSGRQ